MAADRHHCGMMKFMLPLLCAAGLATAAEIEIIRLPDGAMQPRTAVGAAGVTQLVFLTGQPAASDVQIATLTKDGKLNNIKQVNTHGTQAVAMGTVRGPTIATGVSGIRHVLWSGKNGTAAGGKGSALFYSRMDAYFNASPPKDMMGATVALDGGAAVTSDGKSKVWIVWHAALKAGSGEAERRVFICQSNDDGLTFGQPWTPKGETFGVCACCGIAAAVNAKGSLAIWYRTAIAGSGRGARLIELAVGADANTQPKLLAQDDWQLATCPMTTAECCATTQGTVVQWVREFQLQSWSNDAVAAATGQRGAVKNHPRAVANAQGEELRTWVEGSGWNKAGVIRWQVFARDGRPLQLQGGAPATLWSYAAPVLLPDGRWGVIF